MFGEMNIKGAFTFGLITCNVKLQKNMGVNFCWKWVEISHAWQESEWGNTEIWPMTNSYISSLLLWFSMITFTSETNPTGVCMNRTPDQPFRRTRVRFAGTHTSSENSVHIQINRISDINIDIKTVFTYAISSLSN